MTSLSETMGLEESAVTYTHVGCQLHVGGRVPRAGRRHALNGGPAEFTALCGEKVESEQYDGIGCRVEEPENVRPVGHPKAMPITCKRCLRITKGG